MHKEHPSQQQQLSRCLISIDDVESVVLDAHIAYIKATYIAIIYCMLEVKLLLLLNQREISAPHSALTYLPVTGVSQWQRVSALFQPSH